MHGVWLQDLESLETICQNEPARRLFLKMAAMSQHGTLGPFLHEIAADDEIDEDTKETLAEMAGDRSFLLAVEHYLLATQRCH